MRGRFGGPAGLGGWRTFHGREDREATVLGDRTGLIVLLNQRAGKVICKWLYLSQSLWNNFRRQLHELRKNSFRDLGIPTRQFLKLTWSPFWFPLGLFKYPWGNYLDPLKVSSAFSRKSFLLLLINVFIMRVRVCVCELMCMCLYTCVCL